MDIYDQQFVREENLDTRASNIADTTGQRPKSYEEFSGRKKHEGLFDRTIRNIEWSVGGGAIGMLSGFIAKASNRAGAAINGGVIGFIIGGIIGFFRDYTKTDEALNKYNRYLDEFSNRAHAEVKAQRSGGIQQPAQHAANTPDTTVIHAQMSEQVQSQDISSQIQR